MSKLTKKTRTILHNKHFESQDKTQQKNRHTSTFNIKYIISVYPDIYYFGISRWYINANLYYDIYLKKENEHLNTPSNLSYSIPNT